MHNPFSRNRRSATSLYIGLAPTGIAVLKSKGRRHAQISIAADYALSAGDAASPEALAACLSRMLIETDATDHPTTIVVADEWARLFMVTPPQNTTSLQDCQAAATMRFQQLYGESLSAWQLRADWQARQPFLACALPQALLASLQQVAKQHRLTLLSVLPQFIAAWNRWHKSLDAGNWFGVCHGEGLTLGAIEHESLAAVQVMQTPTGAWQDPAWLPAQIERAALRWNLAPPKQLQMCGPIPQADAGDALQATCVRLDAAQSARETRPVSAAVWLARMGLRS